MASFASIRSAVFDREEKKKQYQAHIRGLNAYDRHKKFLDDYGTKFMVNFCYTEAEEQKQALVKLVTCERDRARSDGEDTDDGSEANQERRTKGKKTSSSTADRKDDEDSENFDEFLEGMFLSI